LQNLRSSSANCPPRGELMGIEYRLTVACADREAAAEAIRKLPAVDQNEGLLEIEPEGIYFCDYLGGNGKAILGRLVARLASFGPVTVDEL
jgi:hypothetical protein